MSRPAAPSPVAGAVIAGTRDTPTLFAWTLNGFRYGSQHGTPRERATSQALHALCWVMAPVLFLSQLILLANPHRTYFLTADRTACLSIRTARNGWHLDDFKSQHPGTGQGRALTTLLLPALTAQIHEQHTHLHLVAASDALADQYEQRIPGITRRRHSWPRGIVMAYCPTATHFR